MAQHADYCKDLVNNKDPEGCLNDEGLDRSIIVFLSVGRHLQNWESEDPENYKLGKGTQYNGTTSNCSKNRVLRRRYGCDSATNNSEYTKANVNNSSEHMLLRKRDWISDVIPMTQDDYPIRDRYRQEA